MFATVREEFFAVAKGAAVRRVDAIGRETELDELDPNRLAKIDVMLAGCSVIAPSRVSITFTQSHRLAIQFDVFIRLYPTVPASICHYLFRTLAQQFIE